jgi:hypothetical protein
MVGAFAHDSLRWMGIEHTDVVGVMPSELATVEIRRDMMNYVFIQANGDILHLEFQSSAEKMIYRFLLYDVLLAQKTERKIRTVVFYANQVTTADDYLDIGDAKYRVENIFLVERDGDAALARVQDHVRAGMFTLEDRFELAFAPHMKRSLGLEDTVRRSIALIEQISDERERSYVAALFVELNRRWLDEPSNQRIRKWVEKMDLVKEIVEEAVEKAVEKASKESFAQGVEQGIARTVRLMKQKGETEERIAELLDIPLENVVNILKTQT